MAQETNNQPLTDGDPMLHDATVVPHIPILPPTGSAPLSTIGRLFTTCAAAIHLMICASMLASGICAANTPGRKPSARNDDPCGFPDTTSPAYRLAAAGNWGYGYDSLKADLVHWSANPFVHIDSVGGSVQHRALYLLTIQDTAGDVNQRKRVWIHARTHPNEVQGTWVTNQIIEQLLDSSGFARQMRSQCVFTILPMINPDGVELMLPRQNAHNIDIESNWATVPGEPEVQTLRAMFVTLMARPNPIRIALNMHSAYGTDRYFVYHASAGTSPSYAVKEQAFINSVRGFFPGGIRPYDFFVSWTNGPSLVYPESWFWQNCGEQVLALTYEDMNDASARAFDSTANAILRGIGDALQVIAPSAVADRPALPTGLQLEQNSPNPFNPSTTRVFAVPTLGDGQTASPYVHLAVFDLLGRAVATLVDEPMTPGRHSVRFSPVGLSSGSYLYALRIGALRESRRMVYIR